ncbi:hypothetical protein INR49_021268 [Caranx melampygus]|nr:hypothetical protein INR49_021268 [Caranx melampygus]
METPLSSKKQPCVYADGGKTSSYKTELVALKEECLQMTILSVRKGFSRNVLRLEQCKPVDTEENVQNVRQFVHISLLKQSSDCDGSWPDRSSHSSSAALRRGDGKIQAERRRDVRRSTHRWVTRQLRGQISRCVGGSLGLLTGSATDLQTAAAGPSGSRSAVIAFAAAVTE